MSRSLRGRDFPDELVADQFLARAAFAEKNGKKRLARELVVAAECAQLASMWRERASVEEYDSFLLEALDAVAEKASHVDLAGFEQFYEDETAEA